MNFQGEFYNYSGCGNTFNCSHPVVRQFIVDCLRYDYNKYEIYFSWILFINMSKLFLLLLYVPILDLKTNIYNQIFKRLLTFLLVGIYMLGIGVQLHACFIS